MAESTSPITPLLVTGLLALLGTAASGLIKGCADDELAQRKFQYDMLQKALESPSESTRVRTLSILATTHLIKDQEIRDGIAVLLKHPRRIPQVLPDAAAATLAAPLTPTARIYLLTGRLTDKQDNGAHSLDSLRQPLQKAGFSILNAKYLSDSGRPVAAEVRYFSPADQQQADQLATFFRYWLKRKSLSANLYEDHRVSPGYFEIWIGK